MFYIKLSFVSLQEPKSVKFFYFFFFERETLRMQSYCAPIERRKRQSSFGVVILEIFFFFLHKVNTGRKNVLILESLFTGENRRSASNWSAGRKAFRIY